MKNDLLKIAHITETCFAALKRIVCFEIGKQNYLIWFQCHKYDILPDIPSSDVIAFIAWRKDEGRMRCWCFCISGN